MVCKAMHASVRPSKRIDYTCSNKVAKRVRVIAPLDVGVKILGEDHDPHEQSI